MKPEREIRRAIEARASEHAVRLALKREEQQLTECEGCGEMVEVFREDDDGHLLCEGCHAIPDVNSPNTWDRPDLDFPAPPVIPLITTSEVRIHEAENFAPPIEEK